MINFRNGLQLIIVASLVLVGISSVQAQATRTWVSGVGDDANPCSRTAPCRTFAGAISKTATGGEINALDPGGFGAVTITKSITIDGGPTNSAGILASGINGVVINAPSNARIVLRNLSINGLRTLGVFNGIRFLAGEILYVESCQIEGFDQFGIDFQPANGSFLQVKDSVLRNNRLGNIAIAATTGISRASIDNTTVENGTFGIRAGTNSRVSINRSFASANGSNAAYLADGSGAQMNIESSVAFSNTFGVRARNNAIVRISNVSVASSTNTGLLFELGGQILSFGNNKIGGNPIDGSPSALIVPGPQ